jgi:hypothetical protein
LTFDPGQLMAAVDDGATRLEKAAGAYHDAVLEHERAEALYERDFQKKLLVVYHRAKDSGERMPAEDIRRAMAHELVDAEVYADFLEAKAKREALAVRYRALAASVSARQSLLKSLSGVGG